ncbi:MAG TPA: sigma-70 family RNA polymerase sigma factor [Myxococcales bacterium]|nr:sigma-70 family RNA polymerase sigma factor [Myxococcales bacterium]
MTDERISALYRRYGPVIYWRCLRMLGDEAAAEDVTQETFVRVLRHLEKAPDSEEALRWIWRIATNHCLNEVRNRRRRPEPTDELPDLPAGVPFDEALADRDLVARIIGRVGDKLRAVAWVHYVDGLDHVAAARMLGVSRRTVANRLADFNDKARKILGRLQ